MYFFCDKYKFLLFKSERWFSVYRRMLVVLFIYCLPGAKSVFGNKCFLTEVNIISFLEMLNFKIFVNSMKTLAKYHTCND